jgi:hypothetical protein
VVDGDAIEVKLDEKKEVSTGVFFKCREGAIKNSYNPCEVCRP